MCVVLSLVIATLISKFFSLGLVFKWSCTHVYSSTLLSSFSAITCASPSNEYQSSVPVLGLSPNLHSSSSRNTTLHPVFCIVAALFAAQSFYGSQFKQNYGLGRHQLWLWFRLQDFGGVSCMDFFFLFLFLPESSDNYVSGQPRPILSGPHGMFPYWDHCSVLSQKWVLPWLAVPLLGDFVLVHTMSPGVALVRI